MHIIISNLNVMFVVLQTLYTTKLLHFPPPLPLTPPAPHHHQFILIFASSVRQYNKLKERLKPFIDEFKQTHGYFPSRAEVEQISQSTHDPQLLRDFVKYTIMRSRVLVEIRQLRAKLAEMEQGDFKFKKKKGKKKKIGGVNINDDPLSATEIAMKYIAAMDYRRRRENRLAREAMLEELGTTEEQIVKDDAAAAAARADLVDD